MVNQPRLTRTALQSAAEPAKPIAADAESVKPLTAEEVAASWSTSHA
ncbi:MAG TPA: hypothetical protein VGN81_21900 [Pseudonocardiaceae bacterium]|jgi:hypothetical protein